MKKVLVRCWEIVDYDKKMPHHLYITYPEENSGHDLITCTKCGAIFAITVAKEVYVGPPLKEKLKGMDCLSCGVALDRNFAYYPETYVVNNKLYSFERPQEIPPDETSVIKEFDGIYE